MKVFWNRPPIGLKYLYVIGVSAFSLRFLLGSEFRHSAMVYIFVPFVIAILLQQFTNHSQRQSITAGYLNLFRDSTIVMLATSVILFEGFICVLMFMPIFYFGISAGYVLDILLKSKDGDNARKACIVGLPLLITLMSVEGISEPLSLPRDNQVTHTMFVPHTAETLKRNMAEPIRFEETRHWLVSVFPLPVRVEAGSLRPGDVHRLTFVYKRWFFTNSHTGEMALRIVDVGDDFVKTEIIKNTSYLSNYVDIKGTEVRFAEAAGGTNVSLTVSYRRRLDPSWYFGPLQTFVTRQSAKYLIESVIARQPGRA